MQFALHLTLLCLFNQEEYRLYCETDRPFTAEARGSFPGNSIFKFVFSLHQDSN